MRLRFSAITLEASMLGAGPAGCLDLFAQRLARAEHAHGGIVRADAGLAREVLHRDFVHCHMNRAAEAQTGAAEALLSHRRAAVRAEIARINSIAGQQTATVDVFRALGI
jgi:hypothetical protein